LPQESDEAQDLFGSAVKPNHSIPQDHRHIRFDDRALIVAVNCPEFGGGFILWEDVAHASIEAATVEACVAAPVPA